MKQIEYMINREVAMEQVLAGKFTAQMDQPFVVFLVGMRVNQFFSFKKWMLVSGAFPKMLTELKEHPETGFLHGEQFFRPFPLTTIMVSYWRSFEDLERFARSKDYSHYPAWRDFNQQVGYDGSVGVWHETYAIEPGRYEALYGNMPLFGLAAAAGSATPVVRHNDAARLRLKGTAHAEGQSVQSEKELV